MTAKGSDLEPLFEALGHRFAAPHHLTEALTHPSAGQRRGGGPRRSYERLEFLGDRVLSLAMAELLWSRFPAETEGELSRRHASLVRREALVEVARAIGLGRFIIVGTGEAAARDNGSVLADACEAVIAALYLDGGLAAAQAFVRRYWEAMLAADVEPPRDAKTALQQWALGRGRGLPVYETVSAEGPAHQRIFTVTARIEGGEAASASGSSKRAAETAAAATLLSRLTGGEPQERPS